MEWSPEANPKMRIWGSDPRKPQEKHGEVRMGREGR